MNGKRMVARIGVALGLAVAAVAALFAAYLTAALVMLPFPANADWRPPERGVAIWVEATMVHAEIVVPVRAAGIDWRRHFPAGDVAVPRDAAFVAVGWGERDFFLRTRTWADFSPTVALRSLVGSDRTLVHVSHLSRPPMGADAQMLVLRPAEYRRLAAYLAGSVATDPARAPGYFDHDVFYTGRGDYGLFTTCNTWAGRALRVAGVRMSRWTPVAPAVMVWARRDAQATPVQDAARPAR